MGKHLIYLTVYFFICFIIIFRKQIKKVYNYLFISKKYRLEGKVINFYTENHIFFERIGMMDESIIMQQPNYITFYFIVLKNKNGELYSVKIPQRFFKLFKKGKKILLKTFKKDWEEVYVHQKIHF